MNEATKVFSTLVRLIEGVSYPVPDDSMFVEVWTSSISSHVRKATTEEIVAAKLKHENGICPSGVIFDTRGYAYDVRHCAICGHILGCI